jgi:hypothetical protein
MALQQPERWSFFHDYWSRVRVLSEKKYENEALLPQKTPNFPLASCPENNIKHIQTSLSQARGRLSSTGFYPSSFKDFGDALVKF